MTDDDRKLLLAGLVIEFMGRRVRLIAGEEIESALSRALKDEAPGAGPEEAERFMDWVFAGGRLANFIYSALQLDNIESELWEKVCDAATKLALQYEEQRTNERGHGDGGELSVAGGAAN